MRRIAVNTAIYNNKCIEPAVIELVGDRVEHFFQLKEEISMTEWIEEKWFYKCIRGKLRAYKDGQMLSESQSL